MLDGKKTKAFKIFYDAMDIVSDKHQEEEMTELDVFKKALAALRPRR